MGNSPLVDFTRISPNSTNPRKNAIRKITIHHMAGNLSVESCGNVFAPESRKASSNYAVATDGRIGLYVDEENRAWTSSNADNDNQAVTIEVANDQIGGEWHIGDVALGKLIELCADICRRNHISELIYTGNAAGSLTRHNMFAATACPGPYLQSKFPFIAEEVSRRLSTAAAVSSNAVSPEAVSPGAAPPETLSPEAASLEAITPQLFRVRKAPDDAKSQIGAYGVLHNAISEADRNKAEGYKVYSEDGRLVHDPNAVVIPVSDAIRESGSDVATVSVSVVNGVMVVAGDHDLDLTPFDGQAVASIAQMQAYIQKINPQAPDLAALYIEEGLAEGIRGDIAFAQACLETGNFHFGGDVKAEQYNYAGIGAVGGGAPGNSFASPQIGVRAQIQHLKAYVNKEPLQGECVDPRFKYVERGVSPYVEWLGQRENPLGKGWATGADYGPKILRIVNAIIATEITEEETSKGPDVSDISDAPAEITPEEITVDNALADGLITERDYWLGVLIGTIRPDPAYVKDMMDRACSRLQKKGKRRSSKGKE